MVKIYRRLCTKSRQSRHASFLVLASVAVTIFIFWYIYIFLAEESLTKNENRKHNLKASYRKELGDRLLPKVENVDDIMPEDSFRSNDEQKPENRLIYQSVSSDNPLTSPRIEEYCNVPHFITDGQEGEAPPGYELKSVYTVIRHGDRTTLYTFSQHPNPAISCKFNSEIFSHHSHPQLRSYVQTMKANTGKQMAGNQFEYWKLFPNRSMCDNSFLTPNGALQHIMNGLHLNEKYVQKLQLFGDQFTPDQVNIKVTEYSRTYQSAMALLYGFLPHFNITEINVKLSRGVLFCSERSVGSSCVCPAIQYYRTSSMRDVSMENKMDQLSKIKKTIADVYDLELHQLPFNFAMFDILSSYACHNINLPCNNNGRCITKDTLTRLINYLDEYGAALETSSNYKKHNSLLSYPLLMDIGHHMIAASHGKTNQKFSLYSGHDKTVAPLLSTLGVNSGKLVNYATRVVFELYRRRDAKDHYYIKILRDGKDVTPQVTFCRGKTTDGLCKIKYFLQFLKVDILQDTGYTNYSQACQIKRKRRIR